MPTVEEIVNEYGQDMFDKMVATGFLDAITVWINAQGEVVIPQIDVDVAMKAVRGERIGDWEWD